jgi:hypothetical protein
LTTSSGPWQWAVIWGHPYQGRVRRANVTAFDVDEALTEAAVLHPEWERPRVAFLLDGPELPDDAFLRE